MTPQSWEELEEAIAQEEEPPLYRLSRGELLVLEGLLSRLRAGGQGGEAIDRKIMTVIQRVRRLIGAQRR